MAAEPLNPAAVRLAVAGMRGASDRHYAAARGSGAQDPEAMAITVVEFLDWTCALDERLRKTTDGQAYQGRRDADDDGMVIPGMRHVRDRHMHQVILSLASDGVSFFRRFPPQVSAGFVWRPVDELGEHSLVAERSKPYYIAQREAYRLHLQRRPPWIALRAAQRWVSAEVLRRGIALPDYTES